MRRDYMEPGRLLIWQRCARITAPWFERYFYCDFWVGSRFMWLRCHMH